MASFVFLKSYSQSHHAFLVITDNYCNIHCFGAYLAVLIIFILSHADQLDAACSPAADRGGQKPPALVFIQCI